MPDARGIIQRRALNPVTQQDIHEATKLFFAMQRRELAADNCRNNILRLELWILTLRRSVASVSCAAAGCHCDAAPNVWSDVFERRASLPLRGHPVPGPPHGDLYEQGAL